jgi:uncharacterized repeat protein (TIGR03803 family)
MKHYVSAITIFAAALLVMGARAVTAQEITLYSFKGSANGGDGSVPECDLIFDSAGNLYGTTNSGGGVGAPYDVDGTVFELSPAGGGTWTEKVLYSFGATSTDGIEPLAGLIFDSAGNLYGTTSLGGAHGNGTVFELSPGTGGVWTEKVLYSFGATSTDGTDPRRGSLIFDSAGNLYGTTLLGGPNTVSNGGGVETAGTVFELSPGAGGVWTEKVLYNFGATGTDAANSVAGLIFDAAGNLYGTTKYGGASNDGTVFELSPGTGGVWTEKVLHSFADNGTDGSIPEAGLIFDARGNLYGTTYGGGSNPYSGGLGAVFELSPAGGGNWSEQVLYSFVTGSTGDYPLGGVIFDAAGNLYGTASSELYGFGLVFELSPAAGSWTQKILYSFGDTPDGHAPANGLIFDTAGNLYGTNSTGGVEAADDGLGGTIYEIPNVVTANPTFSPVAGAYTGAQTVTLTDTTAGAAIYYSINGGTSTKYTASLHVTESETIQAVAVSASLPPSQMATASYQIGDIAATPQFAPPAGTYTLTQSVILTDAAPGAIIYYTTNGTTPTTSSTKYTVPITVSATETIKALAVATGYTNSPAGSAAYSITPLTPPQEKVLYNFGATSTDGGVPDAGLVFDTAGNLYGTTKYGGANGAGMVFELKLATGGGWTEKVLYNFGATSTDAAHPIAGLVFDGSGNLYGTTFAGGSVGLGTVFELSPGTGGDWTEKVLHSFGTTLTDGEVPESGLIFDANGNLYGTTEAGGAYDTTYGGASNGYGTAFELSPGTGGNWTEKVLYSFNYLSQTDGYYPAAGLVFDTKGNLYGTTSDGGSGQDLEGGGTVFELSPATGGGWTEKVLYNFGGGSPNGYRILGGVVLDASGNLYGTANSGGNGFGLDGTLFELSPAAGASWALTLLHSFGAYETDGINPTAGLVFDTNGNLYGTTEGGGVNSFGTVFELSPETGGSWTETVLHSFNLTSADGASPYAGLILDATNNLYGTTQYGGTYGSSDTGTAGGTVFEIVSASTSAPVVSLTPIALTFLITKLGSTSAVKMVTLKNTGNATLDINTGGITIGGADASSFSIKTTTCGATLAASASCTISVAFSPAAIGALTGSLNIADNASGSPQSVPLNGTGTEVSLSPNPLAFGTVAISKTLAVTVKNLGTTALTLTSTTITGGGAAEFSVLAYSASPATSTCRNPALTSLAQNATCTYSVEFDNAGANESAAASLNIFDNGGGGSQVESLTGTGTEVSLSPNPLAFGTVTASKTLAVTVKNVGTTALTFSSSPTITGTGAAEFSVLAYSASPATSTCRNPALTSLAQNATCTYSVEFDNADATTGSVTATLNIFDNGGGSPQKEPLSGTGTEVSLSPATLAFGTVATTSTLAVTVKNLGTTALTFSSNPTITGPGETKFSVLAYSASPATSTCRNPALTSLAQNATCTYSVEFDNADATTGSVTATLNIFNNGGGSPQKEALSGTGTEVSLSPATLAFGTVATTSTLAVTVKNLGTTALTFSAKPTVTGTGEANFVVVPYSAPSTSTCLNPALTSLAQGASCTYSVKFTNAGGTTSFTTKLNIFDNGGGSPQLETMTATD